MKGVKEKIALEVFFSSFFVSIFFVFIKKFHMLNFLRDHPHEIFP